MYSPDTHNEAICKAISRDRFEIVVDNTRITEDMYFKARPLFEKLYNNYVKFSIDESIIPYYGRHGTKQFVRGKPIRFSLKLWCITSSIGYLRHAEPYCGINTHLPKTDLGQGADVRLGLLDKGNIYSGSVVTFDNIVNWWLGNNSTK